MQDLGYDENDEYYQRQARQVLIDSTRKNLDDNLEKSELNKHDVFIVSSKVILSLVTNEPLGVAPEIDSDEVRLMEAILKTAHARRYRTQGSAENYLTLFKNNVDKFDRFRRATLNQILPNPILSYPKHELRFVWGPHQGPPY